MALLQYTLLLIDIAVSHVLRRATITCPPTAESEAASRSQCRASEKLTALISARQGLKANTGRRLSETELTAATNRRHTWSKDDEVGRADHVMPGHRLGYT